MIFGEERNRVVAILNYLVMVPTNVVQLQYQKLESKFGGTGGVLVSKYLLLSLNFEFGTLQC